MERLVAIQFSSNCLGSPRERWIRKIQSGKYPQQWRDTLLDYRIKGLGWEENSNILFLKLSHLNPQLFTQDMAQLVQSIWEAVAIQVVDETVQTIPEIKKYAPILRTLGKLSLRMTIGS